MKARLRARGWIPVVVFALCCGGGYRPAAAQEAETVPDNGVVVVVVPQEAVTPETAPVPAAPAVPPKAPLPSPAQGILLNFRDAPLDAVLEYLSEVAGLSVVREQAVEGRITVMSRQPLSMDEAVALLNVALKEKGYAAIAQGKTLKIVPLTDAKKRNVPVRTGSDPAAIEPTDRVVTQIIPLRNVDATKLKQDIAPLLPSYAELSANASSNSLILTDTEANIRRIVEIVRALDTTVSTVAEVRVFQLKYANATNTAKLINEVFKTDQTASSQQGRTGPGQFFAMRMGGPGGAGGQQTADERRQAKVSASADDRTNTVVVSGPSDVLKVVESVVKDLDANPEEEQAVMTYNLKNADAKNLATVLNNLFGVTSATAASRTGGTTTRTGTSRFGGQTGMTASTSATQAAAGLLGQAYVVADTATNALMVMTASKNFERVREIIGELDRSVPQVLIKVLLAEVTHDNSLDLGTEFSVLNLRASGLGQTAGTDFGVAAQTTGLMVNVLEKDVTAALAALQKVGKLDVLSRPYILASDNQAASITVGQEVPFITNTRTTETGQTINTIQYQDIGIILNVTPHINPDGLVILDVSPEISTLTGTTVPISETVNAPVFAKRSATSRVAIRDGQTIVIGGLMEDRRTENVKKVPLLGDVPVLGTLFKRTTTDGSKTELLIFLTPHVAAQPEALAGISEGELKSSKVIKKAVAPGAFDEHMKGMERGAPPAASPAE